MTAPLDVPTHLQIGMLSVLTLGYAGTGLWSRRSLHRQPSWFIDGLLKPGIGAMMVYFPIIGV